MLEAVIHSRLKSPPAKLLRAIAHPAFDFLLNKFYQPPPAPTRDVLVTKGAGRTGEVPYSLLEFVEKAGRTAAMANHAGVDLSNWAIPNETPK